jgi:hypothetical protein
MQLIKHLLKKYGWRLVFYKKIYRGAKLQNRNFKAILDVSPSFSKQKLNVFTAADEDGILLNIFSKINPVTRTFIDIGSNDCINSNCANLAFHHGWYGIFIDGNKTVLNRGKYIYKNYFHNHINRFSFLHAIVTAGNINQIINNLVPGNEVDLLSIDLDGNDYFIWEAISVISPRVVITEVQVEKGNTEFIPEYSHEFELYESNTTKGASPLSMLKLANKKGYELVAANKGCYNLFFVRKDCMKNLRAITIEEALENK